MTLRWKTEIKEVKTAPQDISISFFDYFFNLSSLDVSELPLQL